MDLHFWWAGDARRSWQVYDVSLTLYGTPESAAEWTLAFDLGHRYAADRLAVTRHNAKRARFLAANPLAGIQIRYADPLLTIVTDVPWTEARCKAVTCACAQLGAGFRMTMASGPGHAAYARVAGRSDSLVWAGALVRAFSFIVPPAAPLGWQVSA